VGENMATDWLSTICSLEQRTGSGVALDLIRHENGDIKLYTGSQC